MIFFYFTVDLSGWQGKIEAQMRGEETLSTQISETDSISDLTFKEHVSFKEGTLTIGCVGKRALLCQGFERTKERKHEN